MDESLHRESTATSTPPDRRRLVVIAVILLALIAIGYGAYRFLSPYKLETTLIGFGGMPYSYLYQYEENADDTSPYVLYAESVEGKELPVIAIARGADRDVYYLLLEDQQTGIANIYRKSGILGKMAPVTKSLTKKSGLSVDSASGRFAYRTGYWEEEANIIVYDESLAREFDTGVAGLEAHLLPGGNTMIVSSNESLALYSVEGGAMLSSIGAASPGQFTVNTELGRIEIFNPITKRVDSFTFQTGSDISYSHSSEPLPREPLALGYVDEEVHALLPISAGVPQFEIRNLTAGTVAIRIPSLAPILAPNSLYSL